MAYLMEVFRVDDYPPLQRRQSLLMVEDQLMIVMDLNGLDLVYNNSSPSGKDFEDFIGKYNCLSYWELKNAFQITVKDVMNILGESIPCVGCRRRVERLYYQLMGIGEKALDPLVVKSDGTLVIDENVLKNPKTVCSIFMNHSERLSNLVDRQPRLKKSRRCILHSWDLYKSRPVTPAWKDVWAVMHEKCKAEVLVIDFSTLLSKLESYLKKHRFCADCRTKVMKAYNILVEDNDPTREKGFIPTLYQKIKKCLPGKHIHLPNETKYIDSLIARAELELTGNRRERHAKTIEIAQEEVLTCIGICIYDRLRRIYVRLQEEEFTCRVLAAVSIEALCRNFEKAVEKKRGITQLELLCEEISKEEYAKQQRKETRKLKKKKKKEKKHELEVDEKESCECESDNFVEELMKEENSCECPKVKSPKKNNRHKLQVLERKTKNQLKCSCKECAMKNQSKGLKASQSSPQNNKSKKKKKTDRENVKANSSKKNKNCEEDKYVLKNNNADYSPTENENVTVLTQYQSCRSNSTSPVLQERKSSNRQKQKIRNDAFQDCGYSSEHNIGSSVAPSLSSSLNCSPEGSEVACSEGFCDHEGDCTNDRNIENFKEKKKVQSQGHFSFLLEEMLENASHVVDEDECFIPLEEIQAFRAKMPMVDEKRSQLRQTLKNRFAQLCIKSQALKT